MRCPNCGAELEAGSIYCPVCMQELQIVPDYDPLEELVIGEEPETAYCPNRGGKSRPAGKARKSAVAVEAVLAAFCVPRGNRRLLWHFPFVLPLNGTRK